MIKWMSAQLIQRSINNKEEFRALSLAFAVKVKYRSSQINNFSYSGLAGLFGISRETAKKRINKLREMGLVRDNGKCLIFLSLQEKRYGCKNVEIQKCYGINRNDLKQIERFLRLQAVNIKQSQINHAINCIKATKTAKTAKELRTAKQNLKKIANWNGNVDCGISINTVKKVSGVGVNKAVELLSWGEKKHFLHKTVRFNKESDIFVGEDKWKTSKEERKTFFVSHGRVFSVQPTLVKFRTSKKRISVAPN